MEEEIQELKLFPPSRELAKVAEKWAYGSTHTHSDIAEILQTSQQENLYYQYVADANEILIPKGKMIRNVRGIGYLVVKPDDYRGASFEKVTKSKDFLLRACEIAQHAPVDEMSSDEQDRFDRYLIGLGSRAALFIREFESKKAIEGPMRIQLSERRPALNGNKDEPQ